MLPSSGDASGLLDASVSTGFTGDLDSDANDKDGPTKSTKHKQDQISLR
jgi:hypothetical protein